MDTSPEALGWQLDVTRRAAASARVEPIVEPIRIRTTRRTYATEALPFAYLYREYSWGPQSLRTLHTDPVGMLVGWEMASRRPEIRRWNLGSMLLPVGCEYYFQDRDPRPARVDDFLATVDRTPQGLKRVVALYAKAQRDAATRAKKLETALDALGEYDSPEEVLQHSVLTTQTIRETREWAAEHHSLPRTWFDALEWEGSVVETSMRRAFAAEARTELMIERANDELVDRLWYVLRETVGNARAPGASLRDVAGRGPTRPV